MVSIADLVKSSIATERALVIAAGVGDENGLFFILFIHKMLLKLVFKLLQEIAELLALTFHDEQTICVSC